MKRCESVERTIFLNLIILFLNIYLKLTNHKYFIIKNPLFLSLNDLT